MTGPFFWCKELGHIANDCVLPRETPTCYCCNKLGHISTKCTACDVYCFICKNNRHVTAACRWKRTPATTANAARRIHSTQEEASGVEELCAVSQWMIGLAFATAAVSTAQSGSNNFSPQIKVLINTGNLLSVGLCVSESFFMSLGGQLRDLSPPSFQTANRALEN